MNEDIKKIVEEVVNKVKADPTLLAKVKEDPAGTIQNLVGKEISEEVIKAVENELKTKIAAEGASELLGKLGGLFGK